LLACYPQRWGWFGCLSQLYVLHLEEGSQSGANIVSFKSVIHPRNGTITYYNLLEIAIYTHLQLEFPDLTVEKSLLVDNLWLSHQWAKAKGFCPMSMFKMRHQTQWFMALISYNISYPLVN
jgi:hypothetical protein